MSLKFYQTIFKNMRDISLFLCYNENMVISFFGHADFCEQKDYHDSLYDLVLSLCKNQNSVELFFGGYGNFDSFCYNVCAEIKKIKGSVTLSYVTPYLGSYLEKRTYLQKRYDQIVYPEIENAPKRLAIIKRNEWMINKSDLVICYVNRSFGGAFYSLRYAKRKKKKIFNLVDLKTF